MPSRLGIKEQRDAEDRVRRPFDLLIRVKGRGEEHWGRWGSAERAHEIGNKELRNTSKKPEMHPFNSKCTGYRVVDTRTGETVSDSALVELVERELAPV